ncbi:MULTISPECIES: hypothetical protein [Micromonospora]|uniref:SURF1-like protein n=1 Tax=Micromonospora solifontis TaxID=2487138 RepID=A0ABX9WBR4_9ACTN|nr:MULTISPECIES: hypothetical protein [Micromonospora]NES14468.1 hypothetical protein [Micromonospora sp. PPF5-17B]NES38482.1 hypothetical protein [Micromonospora solifontis]NES56399.1 hypothetical protein [Micromonospora sp. PPF5-6]RNL95301.1 hypothetical protein EFE23_20365 [Micromonospora solifontis]
MTGTKPPAKQKKAATWVFWLTIGLVLLGCVLAGVLNSDGENAVPAPATDERADTVAILRDSSAAQGICYGWLLTDYWEYGDDAISAGSNLGDGVRVAENPSCPRWVQVTAAIRYVPESSESNDTARVEVTGSPDIGPADLSRMRAGLTRFGLTDDVFIDDPGWAVTRAAVMLPLLAAEAGLAEPVTATPTAGAADPSPLPDAGNDLWRDRWGWLLAAAGILLFAALLITVGVRQRRRQLRGRVPAQRAGAGADARTRETA